jgi:hypothetical protein
LAEIRFGIELVADANRRAELSDWLSNKVRPMFEQRVLPITEDIMFKWKTRDSLPGLAWPRDHEAAIGRLAATAERDESSDRSGRIKSVLRNYLHPLKAAERPGVLLTPSGRFRPEADIQFHHVRARIARRPHALSGLWRRTQVLIYAQHISERVL